MRAKPDNAAPWHERAVLLILCAAVGWFYVWTTRSSGEPWHFGAEQKDYYNLLVDGWLDGHLHMKVDVPEGLRRAPNPYDPAQRPPGGLHDASLYQGKYFLYFGVAPVATLLWPFRLLTGTDLPLPAAILVFTFAGFLVSVATWRWIRRCYFPETSAVLDALCVVALGTVSMGPVLVRRANIWELPLSSGYCFAMVAVACVWRTLHAASARAAAGWFAGAGASLGLAVASRPTYLFATGLLGVPLVWWWWRGWRTRAGGAAAEWPLGRTIAGVAALAVVGAGIAWHNYARYGNVFEFGISYQLSSIYEVKARHFAVDYVPFNGWLYWLQPAAWARYFPFIHATGAPPLPSGYFGYEEVFGLLPNAPVLALAALAPWAARRRPAGERAVLAVSLAATAALGMGTATILSFFYAAMARYQIDFAPALLLLACVGAAAAETAAARSPSRLGRWAVVAAVRGLLVWSAVFVVLLSCVLYGNLRRLGPDSYARVARWLDAPVYRLERLAGTTHGPLELEVIFPARSAAPREPLVCTGWSHAADHVFVQYEPSGQTRIGFAHDNGNEELSAPFALNPGTRRRLRVEMGSLYPPEEHPYFAPRTPADIRRLARRLRVVVDGAVVLDRYQRFHPGSPGAIWIGRAGLAGRWSTSFSGKIDGVRRVAPEAAGNAAGTAEALADGLPATFAGLALELRFPAKPAETREPVVVTGETGRGDFLFVEYLDGNRVRFGLDHWGRATIFSPALDLDRAAPHRLEVRLGSFPRRDAAQRVQVVVDGRECWNVPARFHPAEATDVFVGNNPIGGTSCPRMFSGTLLSVTALPAERP